MSEEEIILRRFRRIKDPMSVLIGEKPAACHVPIDELEEKVEMR